MPALDPDERRKAYLDELPLAAGRHRERGWNYEIQGIEYSRDALKLLTYLNAGGLLAIPSGVALFHADPTKVVGALLAAAGCFILALLLTVAAHSFAFFTMARRAESEQNREYSATVGLGFTHYPKGDGSEEGEQIKQFNTAADAKLLRSNVYRWLGIFAFWISTMLFIAGSLIGSYAILASVPLAK